MAEVELYQAQQARKLRNQQLLDEAKAEYAKLNINYQFKGPNYAGRERFEASFDEMERMVQSGNFNLARAVFLSESAVDPSLTWQSFNGTIQNMVKHIQYKLEVDGVPADDLLAKQMLLVNFFTDTLTVRHPERPTPVTSYPMLYDFEDYSGEKDISKLFVSKLMSQGSGQCHSLPLLYLILAKELGIQANLALSPNHSYIKFQDKTGYWHNLELTSHALVSDQFIQNSGYISAEALRNNLFMQPLTEEEVIGNCISDLAMYYGQAFGPEEFVKKAATLSLALNKRSITPHLILNNYYIMNTEYVIAQFKRLGLTPNHFINDPKSQQLVAQVEGFQNYIQNVGYRDMPPEQYEAWLRSVDAAQNKQQHQQKMRSIMGQIGN